LAAKGDFYPITRSPPIKQSLLPYYVSADQKLKHTRYVPRASCKATHQAIFFREFRPPGCGTDPSRADFKCCPDFISKFKVLEQQFRKILPNEPMVSQFYDFLHEYFGTVKYKNERQFMQYVINVTPKESFEGFIS
jgi:hypothetical protein